MRPKCSILVDSSLDFWLTTGRFAAAVRARFARWFGRARMRAGEFRLVGQPAGARRADLAQAGRPAAKPGDEVITVAAGFPTTVNPIIQNGLVPVFVDVTVPTYNVDVTQLEARAVAAHPRHHAGPHAGQPLRPGRGHGVRATARPVADRRLLRRRGVDLRRPQGGHVRRPGDHQLLSRRTTSPWAKAARCSPTQPLLKTLVESFRDWGRDCWCAPGKRQHLRQTLRLAAGRAALRLRPQVHLLAHRLQPEADRHAGGRGRGATGQAGRLHRRAAAQFPAAARGPAPTWKSSSSCPRPRRARTRAGSASRSRCGPARRSRATRRRASWKSARSPRGCCSAATWSASRRIRDRAYRVAGGLANTDFVMNNVFWIGVYPGISEAMCGYMLETLHALPRALGSAAG